MNHKTIAHLIIVSVMCMLCACAKVEPWQRQHLALPEMGFDPQPLNQSFRDHIYYSREAAKGDESAAGGGCGCN